MIEYTGEKIDEDKAEKKLDNYVAAEMGCYVLFVSEQDGPRFLSHAYVEYISS